MSITNYTELLTAISTFTARADLTGLAADFVTLAESRLNRSLRLRGMENAATLSTSTTDRFATLPTGFLEAIDLGLQASGAQQVLTQIPLSEINFANSTTTTMPHWYAVTSNIVFDVVSDQVYTLDFRYYKKLDIANDTTNFLLTAYPDIYLNACIVEVFVYNNNQSRAQVYEMRLQAGLDELKRQEGRTRSRAKMMTELGGQLTKQNIITGDYA